MNETYKLIWEAIDKKQQIHASYDGHFRQMCPHILGIKEGRYQALFYQFGGTSKSRLRGDGSDWKCMDISKLVDVEAKAGEWHTGKITTGRKSTCVDKIDKEV